MKIKKKKSISYVAVAMRTKKINRIALGNTVRSHFYYETKKQDKQTRTKAMLCCYGNDNKTSKQDRIAPLAFKAWQHCKKPFFIVKQKCNSINKQE